MNFENKHQILFVCRNMPHPKKPDNNIILQLIKKLSHDWDISTIYPSPFVPLGFNFINKYKEDWMLKDWTFEDLKLSVFKFLWLPSKKFGFLFWRINTLKSLFKRIGDKRFSLIHAHYLFPDGIIASSISGKLKIPFCLTVRRSDISLLKRIAKKTYNFRIAENILTNARKVFVLNGAVQSDLKTMFGINAEIIPHGIEEERILEEVPLINSDNIIISCIAKPSKKKNIDWVINAVKGYEGKKKVHLKIAGPPEIKSDTNKNKSISYLGQLDQIGIDSLLEESQIFCLPSEHESFGLVYLEAAAKGNAIIGKTNEGVWGVFQQENEMLFAQNYKGFENQLHHLIDNPDLQYQLAKNSHKKTKTMGWKKIIALYNSHYTEMIS